MKYLRTLLLIFIILVVGLNFATLNVIAGTEDAEMADVSLSATPSRQGLGGEMIIDAAIDFFGGCCYPLWAYNVQATINIPENVELTDGLATQRIGEVKALEGGAATTIHFKWKIKSMIPNEYLIRVNLTTKNCGNSNREVLVEYVEGLSMSIPVIYPDIPTTDSETLVMMDIRSGLEGIEVDSVELFYITTDDSKFDIDKIETENDTMIVGQSIKKGAQAAAFEIEYTTDSWKSSIPRQPEECTVYYWLVAEDSTGKNTTSVVYSFEVQDLEQIYFVVDILNWLPIIGTIIGIIIIVYLFKRLRAPLIGKGELVLGGSSIKDIHGTKIDKTKLKKLNLNREIVVILLLIVSIIILLWTVYAGHFIEFARLNGGI
jgi:hypothetical protein